MKKLLTFLPLMVLILASCGEKTETDAVDEEMSEKHKMIKERIEAYAPVNITADISHLDERQKKLIKLLAEAGHLADEIFWKQSAHSAVEIRDSLMNEDSQEAADILEYVNINYGPYDVIHGNKRFVGKGPEVRPKGGGFYPVDMTKEEFETFVKENPGKKEEMKSQYTVIKRDKDGNLKPVPYHVNYPKAIELADKLEEAAKVTDNPSLKKYLELRADAIRTDDYLKSDMAWMDLEDNDIDLVIGPIENYEDELYNYKTAYEAVVMVKNHEGTKELNIFKSHLDDFEKRLPIDDKYKKESINEGTELQIVDVVYFGGDCQKGTKTIAAALPNDPRVSEAKGRKMSMYINLMEAKFDKIVTGIGAKLLDKSIAPNVDKKAFTRFVTLHEVSHGLGPSYVYGSENESVRRVLKDRYSPIEETKADIVSMYNHKHLNDMGILSDREVKNAMATYLAGLYRSIRFGTNSAHGRANLIQLNYLKEEGAIVKLDNGKFKINTAIFFDKVAGLAKLILETQAMGDYEKAGEILDTYSVLTPEIKAEIESLSDIPRDINSTYEY